MKYNSASSKPYDSKAEKARAAELYAALAEGRISELGDSKFCSMRYPLHPDGCPDKIEYIPDFQYRDEADFCGLGLKAGELVIEDVKGKQTDVFRLKSKLFNFYYGDSCKFIITKAKYKRTNGKSQIDSFVVLPYPFKEERKKKNGKRKSTRSSKSAS